MSFVSNINCKSSDPFIYPYIDTFCFQGSGGEPPHTFDSSVEECMKCILPSGVQGRVGLTKHIRPVFDSVLQMGFTGIVRSGKYRRVGLE